MFLRQGAQVRRARRQVGHLTPLAIPAKGLNTRDAFALMGPEYAITLKNVLVEPYGLRTRKGYTEWATNLPGNSAVNTVMSYYPATASPAALASYPPLITNIRKMFVTPAAAPVPPVGKLFAATNGSIFDVTAGGTGPWVPQAGVPAGNLNYWSWTNFQNVAASYLIICNRLGGYAYYNGAAWTTPVQGTGAGQIANVNPALFCHVIQHMKRLWFIEVNSTRAWYLPVSQVTGNATGFNFGEQFKHGGRLDMLIPFTVDGGEGVNDYLVAISSQGDVVVYKGLDPDSPTDWQLHGVWYVGPLPVGRRAAVNTGSDIHILSQYGVTPLSVLLSSGGRLGIVEQSRPSFLIAPLIARLMRDYSTLLGWQIAVMPKEELMLVRIPTGAGANAGQFLALKVLTGGWSILGDLPFNDLVNIDSAIFAGTPDGRVVRAFDGPLDNVKLNSSAIGDPILCEVTPSYQAMGAPGNQKVFKLLRPTFITTITPSLSLQILTDYGLPKTDIVPTLPPLVHALWNGPPPVPGGAKWNLSKWSGVQQPIKEWLGCHGVGFVGTAQLSYRTGGDTLLTSIDFWTEQGGVL